MAIHTMAYRVTMDMNTPLQDVALGSTEPMTMFSGELPFGGSPTNGSLVRKITRSRTSVHGGLYLIYGTDAIVSSITGYDFMVVYATHTAYKCFRSDNTEVPSCLGRCVDGDVCLDQNGKYDPNIYTNWGTQDCSYFNGTEATDYTKVTVTCGPDRVYQCFGTDGTFLPENQCAPFASGSTPACTLEGVDVPGTECKQKLPCVRKADGAILTNSYCPDDTSTLCVGEDGENLDENYASCVKDLAYVNPSEHITSFDVAPITDLVVATREDGMLLAIDISQGGVLEILSGFPGAPDENEAMDTVHCFVSTCYVMRLYFNGTLVYFHNVFPGSP